MSSDLMQDMADLEKTQRSSPLGPSDDSAKGKNLLEIKDEKVVAKAVFEMFTQDQQSPRHRRRMVQWRVNRLRRMGYTNVHMIKRRDTSEWIVWAPPGSARQTPSLNKAARLCRLLKSTLFVDPPIPEATPEKDDDESRDAAEFTTRVLVNVGSEAGVEDATTAARAFDLGSTYGSGFRLHYIDPAGGGDVPVQVQAGEGATTVQDAIVAVDPATGASSPRPKPWTLRYVAQDGNTLTDKVEEALRRPVPKLKHRVLTGHNVRAIPGTAADVWDAEGLLIATFTTLEDLRRLWPQKMKEIEADPERLKKLVSYRPEKAEELLQGGRMRRDELNRNVDKNLGGATLVFTVLVYYRKGPTYKQGAFLIVAGEEELLHRQTWVDPRTGVVLDIPVDQFKQVDDEDDFAGIGMMTLTGPGNEIRAGTLGSLLEHMDRFNNRKVFWPTNSLLQPKAIQSATGTYLPMNPGGKPEFEQIPDFPRAAIEMFKLITDELDHESGFEPPSQGVATPSVQSGIHAQTLIEQVNVGLSDIRNNTIRGLERGWRIDGQLIRAFYTVPQLIHWVSDDGAYKAREWMGGDISFNDIRLQKGSLSMLAPSAKAAIAEALFNMRDPTTGEGLITLEELRRIAIGNVGGLIGVQDNPHWMRIRSQIADWAEGPPAPTGQPEQDAMVIQESGASIFSPLPVDDEPDVAKVRHLELKRLLCSKRYTKQPPAWRMFVDKEYQRARAAAGIQTLAEQAEAQQAAQQQALDAQKAAADQQAQAENDKIAMQHQFDTEKQAASDGAAQKQTADGQQNLLKLAQAMKPEAPQVTVHPPSVTVNPPVVNIHPPDVTVNTAPITIEPPAITVNVPRAGKVAVKTDTKGRITHLAPEEGE